MSGNVQGAIAVKPVGPGAIAAKHAILLQKEHEWNFQDFVMRF